MNRIGFFGVDRTRFIHRLADHVENPAEGFFAYWHGNSRTRIHHVHAADQTFGGVHGDTADRVFTQVLRHFQNEIPRLVTDRRIGSLQGVVDRRQRAVGKLHVDDRAQNLGDFPHVHKY